MKKLSALLIALALILGLVPAALAVTDDHTLNGFPIEKGIYTGKSIRIATPWPPAELPKEAVDFQAHTGLTIAYEAIPGGVDANGNDYKQAVINMMAAGDSPDVLYCANFTVPVWVNKNLVQPWDAYIDFSSGLASLNMSPICDTLFTMNGEHYGIGDLTAPLWNSSVIFYNKEALEDAGLDDPYELFKEGKWKWDAFSEMCQKLTYDGGSGNIDHWGLATWFTVEPFVTSNGGTSVKLEDGKPVYSLNSPEAVFGMNYALSNMPTGPSLDTRGPDEYFADGTAAMYYEGWWYIDDARKLYGDDLGLVPFPTGPDYDATPCRDYGEWCWVYHLSSSAKEPQAAADYLRYAMSTKEFDEPQKPVDYSVWGGEDMYKEVLTWVGNTAMDPARSYGTLSDLLYEKVWWAMGNDTPANLTESVAQEAQAVIDEAMK